MRFKKLLLTAFTLILLVGSLSAVDSFQASTSPLDLIKSRIKVVQLSERVIVLTGNLLPGGGYNIAINSDRGLVIVDTGGSPGIASLLREIIQKEFGQEKFAYVIHTHGHGDHVNGNQVFPEAQVVAHENAVKNFTRYSDPKLLEEMAESCRKQAKNYREKLKSLDSDSEDYEITERRIAINEQIVIDIEKGVHIQFPDITFSDRMNLDMGDLTLKMYYLKNYHSDSDILIHIPEEGILLHGDTLSRAGLPGTNSFLSSVDIPGWIKVLDRILTDGAGVKHAARGHSYIMTGEEIATRRDYIKQIWNAVINANSEGLTPDDILPKLPLENYEFLIRQYQRKPEELKNQHERVVIGFWRQLQDKEFAAEILMDAYLGSSLDSAIEIYKGMFPNRDKYYFDENMVNSFAQMLLSEGDAGKAVELLKVHSIIFSESARVHSLLGDALMADGKRDEAIKAYTKAISINPTSKAIKDKLEKAKILKK